MPHQIKIATCCYCAARTMLKPTARHGHELACGSCGAPLHEMKWLKGPTATRPRKPEPKPAKSARPVRFTHSKPRKSYKPKRSKKRRKSSFFEMAEEVWDWVEDIID